MNGGDEERRGGGTGGGGGQTEISSIVFERARICNFLESTLGDDKISSSIVHCGRPLTTKPQNHHHNCLSSQSAATFNIPKGPFRFSSSISLLFIFSSSPISRGIYLGPCYVSLLGVPKFGALSSPFWIGSESHS